MLENAEMTSVEKVPEIPESVLRLTEPIFEAFKSQIEIGGEFDKIQFLDEAKVVRESLGTDEVGVFDQQVQTNLKILQLLQLIAGVEN
ncbi:hypothetical protein KAI54_01440 [Candidatus Gracilibacteria bacterium]|nr:hypothetical protein [Candidatus Gracilibacteria bacterium]